MRAWASEQLVVTWRPRRARALLSFSAILAVVAAALAVSYRIGLSRYADPVPAVLASPGADFESKAEWLAQVLARKDLHADLRASYRPDLAAARRYLRLLADLRAGVEGARDVRDLPPQGDYAALRAQLDTLERRGWNGALERSELVAIEGEVRLQGRRWSAEQERLEQAHAARSARIERVLAAARARRAALRDQCLRAAAEIGRMLRARCDPRAGELADRNAFFALLCRNLPLIALRRIAAEPSLRGDLDADFLALAALEQALVEGARGRELADLQAWGPTRRLELCQRIAEVLPPPYSVALEAEREILSGLARGESAAAGEGADPEDLARRCLGLLVTSRDIESLLDTRLLAAAVARAEALRDAIEGIPEELGPWAFLDHVAAVSAQQLAGVEKGLWERWILLLDQAVEEGHLTSDLPAIMRLAVVGGVFGQDTASAALRSIATAEGSGVFHSLVEQRPFCELGALVAMLREVLEGLNERLGTRAADWRRWRVVVEELLRTLMLADRYLGEVCVAASEPINRGAQHGAVRAQIFRTHEKRIEVARLRTRWNERTRKFPTGSSARRVRDAIFQLMYKQERVLEARLQHESLESLHRPGVALRLDAREHRPPDEIATALPWPELPRPAVQLTAGEVRELIDAGVGPDELRSWSGSERIEPGAAIELPLSRVPQRYELLAPAAAEGLRISLRLPRQEPLALDLAAFRLDPWKRFDVLLFAAPAGGLVVLIAAAFLLRRRPPRAFVLAGGESGESLVRIEGGLPPATFQLADAHGAEVLLRWRAGRAEPRIEAARRLPSYALRYIRAGRRSGRLVFALEPALPRIEKIVDSEFEANHQIISIAGRHLGSRVRMWLDEDEVTCYRRLPADAEEHSPGLSQLELALPEGRLAEGPRQLVLRSPAGATQAVTTVVGHTRLLRTNLEAFYFASNGRRVVDLEILLGNDRAPAPGLKLGDDAGDGAGDGAPVIEREDQVDSARGMRRIRATLALEVGSHRLTLSTATSDLSREVRVLASDARVLMAVVRGREGDTRVHFQRLDAAGAGASLPARFLSSAPSILRAVFCGSNLYLAGADAVLRFAPGCEEGEALVLPHREALGDYQHISFAESREGGAEQIYMGLAREADRGGKVVTWQVPAPGQPSAVGAVPATDLADQALVEIAAFEGQILYIANDEVRVLGEPGRPWRRARSSSFLRLFPLAGELLAVDRNYRLRALTPPEVPEIANLAARESFVDPLRILSIQRAGAELEVASVDVSRRDRLLLMRLDPAAHTLRKDRAQMFDFDGTVLAARVCHGG